MDSTYDVLWIKESKDIIWCHPICCRYKIQTGEPFGSPPWPVCSIIVKPSYPNKIHLAYPPICGISEIIKFSPNYEIFTKINWVIINHICATWSHVANIEKLFQPNNKKKFFLYRKLLINSPSTSPSVFILGKLRIFANVYNGYFTLNIAYDYLFLFFKASYSIVYGKKNVS